MRLEDIKAPPIAPESRERVTALLGRAADVADLLRASHRPNRSARTKAAAEHVGEQEGVDVDRQHVTEGADIQAWTVRNPDGRLVEIRFGAGGPPLAYPPDFQVRLEDLDAACDEMQRDLRERRKP